MRYGKKCKGGKYRSAWKMREQKAGVENTGVWKAEPILYIERPLIKLLPKNFPQTYE